MQIYSNQKVTRGTVINLTDTATKSYVVQSCINNEFMFGDEFHSDTHTKYTVIVKELDQRVEAEKVVLQ